MMNNEKEKDAIDESKLDEILPKYDPLKLNGINLAQNYVSAFNTGMNIYQCVNQLQGYIEWVVKAVNDVVKSWNVQVGESIDQSKAIVRETTTEQFNTEWTNKQPELIEQVNTLTTNQFNEDWGVLENRINTTLETQNTNIQNIQNEQNELETNTNNAINAQNTKINSIQTQQNNLASNQTNLANRMDTFTSLSEGSTTGDAELKDIRVGANGVTYPNAGDAVRGQYSQLKEDLDGVLCKKIKTSRIGQFNQDSNTVNSIKYNEYNDLVWTFKRNTGYIAAFVEISNPDKFKVKKYTASIYNPNPFNISVRLYISTNGYNWSPDNAYVSNIVSLKSGEKKSVQIDNSKYDSIKNSSGHVYLIYETISQSDLGKNTDVLTCVFESNSMQSELGFSVSAENALNAENAQNAQNAQNAVNGQNVHFYIQEGIDKSYVVDGKLGGVRIKFEKGDVTSNICVITTESIGKVSELRDKAFLVRCVNRNENSDDDNSVGWTLAHTNTKNHQWGHDNGQWATIYTLAKDGIRFLTIDFDNDNYKDDDDVYLRINNKNSYKPQTEFSMDMEVIIWVVDKEYEKEMGTYIASRLIGFEPSEYVKKADVSSLINAEKYITCWGDSLTAGGGWTNTLQQLSNMTVYNGGTGGEGSNTIVARQGADVMMINNITIPSDTTPVIIAKRSVDGGITTFEGNKVTPLLQGGAHVNPCKIGDVVGTLKWTGSDYADTNGTWTFERNESGNQVVINRPTAIRTDYDMNRNAPYLMVIFIGQNGGYSDLDDLVRQHRLMIEHANARHVVVLGLSSGTKEQRASYEARMRKEFGRYFISLREYLSTPIYDNSGTIISCYGMEDQNVSIDSSYTYNGKTTLQEIQEGSVPHQILADGVHYTSGTKDVIGKMIYKKCCELGIF